MRELGADALWSDFRARVEAAGHTVSYATFTNYRKKLFPRPTEADDQPLARLPKATSSVTVDAVPAAALDVATVIDVLEDLKAAAAKVGGFANLRRLVDVME